MRWAIAAVALVAAANGVVLLATRREHAAQASLTSIDVCADHVEGGGRSDDAPALRLVIAPDSLAIHAGMDAAGLRALGHSEAVIAAVGRARDSTFRWPRPRPAWVRLRQRDDSLARWAVVEVAPLGASLARDSTSVVVRGLVGFQERRSSATPVEEAAHDHAARSRARVPGVIQPVVLELMPARLHLDRQQIATLRAGTADTIGCAVKRQAVLASGAKGGIWVESVR